MAGKWWMFLVVASLVTVQSLGGCDASGEDGLGDEDTIASQIEASDGLEVHEVSDSHEVGAETVAPPVDVEDALDCGGCSEGTTCIVGEDGVSASCVPCAESCDAAECGISCDGAICGSCSGGQECADFMCSGCWPDCAGVEGQCGDDGCNGSCGVCPLGEVCVYEGWGLCEPCVETCGDEECGYACDGSLCGQCAEYEDCVGFECHPCEPNCDGRQCGDDGCGGSCGVCGEMEACLTKYEDSYFVPPDNPYVCVSCFDLEDCGTTGVVVCIDLDDEWGNGTEATAYGICAMDCMQSYTVQIADGPCE